MNNQVIDAIIKYLESKSQLTEYEKDIIDTSREINKFPEDRDGILKQLSKNKKYNIEKIELNSKLEARNEIDKIITEHAPKRYDYLEEDE